MSTVVEVHGIRHLSMGVDDHGNCGVAASTEDLKDLGFVFPQEKKGNFIIVPKYNWVAWCHGIKTLLTDS